MSLTRSLLKELQISPDAAERIIAAHAESIDALRQERDAARGEAAQLESIRAALAEMTQARDEACQARDSAREELSALGEEGERGGKPFIHVTPYLLCPPETPLELDDIIRREKDGTHYRVCSRPEDRRTPLCAGFPYAEVRLERVEADA